MTIRSTARSCRTGAREATGRAICAGQRVALLAAALAAGSAGLLGAAFSSAAPAGAAGAIAMHGEPQLAPGAPLPYVDPAAPQGGRIAFGATGSFDNLNPMIPRGAQAPGLRDSLYGNLVYESLLERNHDEPFSLYGLLATDVEVPPDRSHVTFTLDERARFSDGTPVTAQDVAFTLRLLREKGRPYARVYYAKVAAIETPDARTVTFRFAEANDRELPLILGLMPILPRHDTDPQTFERTTLDPPLGSGPYVVAEARGGRTLLFRRDPDYWGNDHPLNHGRYNAHEILFRFYRDATAMFEAFKTGEIDVFLESDPARWATGYDFPAARDGRVVRTQIPTGTPRGMLAFVFNTRRPPFDDIRVRRALNHLFDFPWINAQLFHGHMRRTTSYFEPSALQSTGRPASIEELALLSPYPETVLPEALAGTLLPPRLDGSGRDRKQIAEALRLLAEAGWHVRNGALVDENGRPFAFEILVATQGDERIALAFQRLLRPIGIAANVRYVDAAQYNERMLAFDFDMARVLWTASLSPGNEQTHRWSAAAADTEGSFNYAGTREAAVDAMIAAMLSAQTEDAFVAAVRALDRVLLSGTYVIPLYHSPVQWVAHWSRLGRPERQSLSGVELETWWVKP